MFVMTIKIKEEILYLDVFFFSFFHHLSQKLVARALATTFQNQRNDSEIMLEF